MWIVEDKWFLRGSIVGMALWPVILLRKSYLDSNPKRLESIIRHELIHCEQQKEMLILPFYIWYVTEWLIKLCFLGKKRAYRAISFEREAYMHEDDPTYIQTRKRFSFLKFI
jgi:hypothetical protein